MCASSQLDFSAMLAEAFVRPEFPDHDYTIHVLKSVKVLDGDCAVTEASEDMTDERAMSVGHDESIRQPDLLRAVDTKRFGHHLDID